MWTIQWLGRTPLLPNNPANPTGSHLCKLSGFFFSSHGHLPSSPPPHPTRGSELSWTQLVRAPRSLMSMHPQVDLGCTMLVTQTG